MSKPKRKIQNFRVCPEDEKMQLGLSVFNALKTDPGRPIKAVAQKAGVPEGAAADYINSCVKEGLLKIAGAGDGAVEFDGARKKSLGVGFWRDQCILTVMDVSGKVEASEKIQIAPMKEFRGKNKEVKEIIEKIKNETALAGSDFIYAGVAVPEVMRESNEKAAEILGEGVSRIFRCDVFTCGEATAAAYAETDKREGEEAVLYVFSDIGTGVVIKNEMIYEAVDDTSSDDSYLRPWSQFSIVETAKKLVNNGVGTDIVNMVGGDIENITLPVVLAAADKKDELAEDLIKRTGLALGVRVAYLANMFRPDVVVLGGGTEGEKGDFPQFVQESADRFLIKEAKEALEIVRGVLGAEASSIGTASLCRREIFMEV
ncbi:MAG: ROK family protein [Candidatus Tantalella remota]|nr:ROK family protein [Candidatus Tantalella remota]